MRILIPILALASLRVSAQTGAFSEHDPRYRLQPTDVLEVHYRYTPEFDQTVSLQPDGFVSLQIVGDIKLQGLTLDQVKATILEKAKERLRDPEINLALKEFEKDYKKAQERREIALDAALLKLLDALEAGGMPPPDEDPKKDSNGEPPRL